MRCVIYNAHWRAMGGGEVVAGEIAAAMANAHHDVIVLGPSGINYTAVGDRLGFSSLGVRYYAADRESDVISASRQAHIFVNASFGGILPPMAPRSVLYCHFPTVTRRDLFLDRLERTTRRWARRSALRIRSADREWSSSGDEVVFGAGDALIESFPAGAQLHVRNEGLYAEIEVVAGPVSRILQPQEGMVVPLEAGSEFIVRGMHFQDALWPRWSMHLTGVGKSSPVEVATWRRLRPRSLRRISNYSEIWANSEFTRLWVGKRWNRVADVVYPPVSQLSVHAVRNPHKIVSVGRFFPPGRGHSKRQLDLVEAFRVLVGTYPEFPWQLVLIGNVSTTDEAYYRAVVAASAGLNVKFLRDASRHVLEQEVASAGFMWSATGLEEDLKRWPERAEHFGISVVEAMSAGVIPITATVGGPAEVVATPECTVRGFADFPATTVQLLGRDDLRAAFVSRAREFSRERFHERVVVGLEALYLS